MSTSQASLQPSQQARGRSSSLDTKDSLRARREQLVPAFVLTWTSEIAYTLCPFSSCQQVHEHGYTTSEEWILNSRQSECESAKQEYRLLFPFEDDPVVNGFGVEVDREKCIWRTVSGDLEDPRAEEEDMSHFCSQLAATRIEEEEYLLGIDLEDEEGNWFIHGCVCNDLTFCESTLQSSHNPGRLVKGKDPNGNSALSLACMGGHLEIVQLLCKHNAELENINKEGKTPLMVALSYGHGAIATHLTGVGASVMARDNEGISVLEISKSTLKELEEMEWMRSRIENETRARCLDRKKNREHFTKIIDLCNAHLKTLQAMKKVSSTSLRKKQSITFVQSGEGRATELSVYLNTFTVPIANKKRQEKTFAYLIRGAPFEDVFAVSGYSQGEFGGIDGCLDREEWTAKVFVFSKAVGHSLKVWPKMDKNGRPGSHYACHAEKQVMAYFLWKHTTLQDEVTDDSDEDEELEERSLKLKALEKSKPTVLRIRKDVYVTTKPCPDCEDFQKRVSEVTGIGFDLIFLPSKKPTSQQKGGGQKSIEKRA